jgi:hypothetical protein
MAEISYKMPPFRHSLLLWAYMMCFERRDEQLHLSIFLTRNLTSSTHLSRHYISVLEKAVLLTFYRSKVRLPLPGSTKLSNLSLISPALSYAQGQETICEIRSHLKENILNGKVSAEKLEEMVLEVLTGDAVEYVDYYLRRRGSTLRGANLIDARLRVMLQTYNIGQVFMLLWRAVRNACRDHSAGQSSLLFDEVIKLAWQYNLQYQKHGAIIENYSRPEPMLHSKVASILFHDLLGIVGNTDLLNGSREYISASPLFNEATSQRNAWTDL